MGLRRRALAWLVLASVTGCDKPPSPSDQVAPVDLPPPPPPVECRPPPPGELVAEWTGPERCPISVALSGGMLRLEDRSMKRPVVATAAAPTCVVAACRYEGVSTELGPMLVVTEPGAQSEIPTSAMLGVVAEDTLVFVDLWAGAGQPVIEDDTAIGPSHGLVAMRCGDELGLFGRARVPSLGHLQVPPDLAAREGRMALRRGATVRPADASGCVAIALPLP